MSTVRTIISWGWSSMIITALAIVGFYYEWSLEIIAPALGVTLVIGLLVAVVRAREQQLERSAQRLRQLSGYFSRRFSGNSSLSIFAVIDTLFNIDNPPLWDWARACDMARRVFDTWCDSFITRVESDIRTRRFGLYLTVYLNELWLLNGRYYELIEQFYEIAERVEIPAATVDHYNRLVVEYNTFVRSFQDSIAELKNTAKTEIEPPSVRLARELSAVK